MRQPSAAQIEAWLKAIARRDQMAFRQLYEAFGRRVYAFLLHRFQNDSIAEEVVSDTLLHVWNQPGAFRGDSAFATWLLGVARFKMMERLRQRPTGTDSIDDFADDLPSDATGPEDVAALRERREGVYGCLDALPAEQRECMLLAYFEGWTLEEIGAHLQQKKETIGTRLFYARKKIQACLQALLARELGERRG